MKEERLHTILELIGWVAVFVTVICILNSCGPCKKCPVVGQRDSIYVERVDSVFVRDTILLYQPQDSTASNVVLDTEKSHLETDLATSDAWVDNGKLHHSLSNKTDLIPISVQIPNYISREVKHYFQVVTKKVERDFKWWEEFFMFLGKILVIASAIVLFVKVLKRWVIKRV